MRSEGPLYSPPSARTRQGVLPARWVSWKGTASAPEDRSIAPIPPTIQIRRLAMWNTDPPSVRRAQWLLAGTSRLRDTTHAPPSQRGSVAVFGLNPAGRVL